MKIQYSVLMATKGYHDNIHLQRQSKLDLGLVNLKNWSNTVCKQCIASGSLQEKHKQTEITKELTSLTRKLAPQLLCSSYASSFPWPVDKIHLLLSAALRPSCHTFAASDSSLAELHWVSG